MLKWFLCDYMLRTYCGKTIKFKGIPYAQPPVGNLRWKKPLPLWTNASWCNSKNHFKATSFGSACFQLNPFLKQFEGQEDCLYLNIWTPTLDPEAGLEVMVWIHGGFLQFGSGHQKGLSPNGHLAKLLNVAFVSFNFRLHVLGYLALDTLFNNLLEDSRGNYGTWDQLVVMEWVRDNILYFGGDPKKVTVFGPDGGAASVLTMMTSSYFRNTFRSAWLLGPAMVFNRSFSDSSHHNRGHFLDKSGCALDVQCLRKMTPKEVTGTYIWNDDASFRIRDQNDLPIQGILPEQLVVVDGDVLPLSPIEAVLHRNIKDIPMLIGTSAQAVDFWPGPEDLRSWSWNQYRKYVTTSLDSFDPRISQLTMQLYNTSHVYDDEPSPELLYTTMVSDIRQTCPVNDFTDMLSSVTNSPVFRYVVTSRPSTPDFLKKEIQHIEVSILKDLFSRFHETIYKSFPKGSTDAVAKEFPPLHMGCFPLPRKLKLKLRDELSPRATVVSFRKQARACIRCEGNKFQLRH
ncbi:Cholinesterase [Araneus ventricosus]|uniref:Cholinesterase n=1 Tax=Araneus ventricosus TaxID=182803 RepID=A0A4Y2BH61_ARAVE|nr:Cholinesterase [Araneus ventricosus]